MATRLTIHEREQVQNMLNARMSLRTISERVGRSKSTIYHHYQKKYGRYTPDIVFNLTDEELGEFVGVFAGDGHFLFEPKTYKYKIRVFTGAKDTQYHNSLQEFFTKIFGKHPQSYALPQYNVLVIQYYSKAIYLLLQKYLFWEGIKAHSVMLREMETHSEEFLKGFLRGLFDTDGNSYKPKRRAVFATASLGLANQIRKILDAHELRFSFYENSQVYRLDLYGKSASRLIKLINPRNENKTVVV